jgi:hypothetical protein
MVFKSSTENVYKSVFDLTEVPDNNSLSTQLEAVSETNQRPLEIHVKVQ